MAAFHLSAKVHSRSSGASAVRAAAYRAGERLECVRTGQSADYSAKSDVIEALIFTPQGAPDWMNDRASLWNAVEAAEKRRDAQLAYEIEMNLPRELDDAQNWLLLADFVRKHITPKGLVADVAFHKPNRASDGQPHPHAHILIAMREVTPQGFGKKHPAVSWQSFKGKESLLKELRAAWCEFARERAASLGHDLGPDWDARSYADRGINLEPQAKRGATADRLEREGQPSDNAAAWLDKQAENSARLKADPMIALKALTSQSSTFSHRDLARFIDRHTTPLDFAKVYQKAQAAAVYLGRDANGLHRFTTREMIDLEKRLEGVGASLAAKSGHGLKRQPVEAMLTKSSLSEEQRDAVRHLIENGDLANLVGYAGTGKSTTLGALRQAYEAQGYSVKGAALSGIAAQNLEEGSGIQSRTLASYRYSWQRGRDQLTARDVLVIDEAGMIGSREMLAMLRAAQQAGAKVVLVGDPEQLQAIEAGAAFRALMERHGAATLSTVFRQSQNWRKIATEELSTARTSGALGRFQAHGALEAQDTSEGAQAALLARWKADRIKAPGDSQLILAHTRKDVRALNEGARALLKAEGLLGREDYRVETSRGARLFASGERILFLRNERGLGVKNGTMGELVAIESGELVIRLDNGKSVRINPRDYEDLDHGYAATVHKAQGVTVTRAYVFASQGFDRHLTNVAMTRDRKGVRLYYGRDQFGTDDKLFSTLARARPKDTTLDYEEAMIEARDLFKPEARAPKIAPPERLGRLLASTRHRAALIGKELFADKARERDQGREHD